jgi:hypothetical protein
MVTFKEKLQAIRERLTNKQGVRSESRPRVAATGIGERRATDIETAQTLKAYKERAKAQSDIIKQEKQEKIKQRIEHVGAIAGTIVSRGGKAIQSARHDIGKATGAFYQVTTGGNPNIKAKRLSRAEKQALRKDGAQRRSPREQSKIVKASRQRAIGGALAYQNVKSDRSPEQAGITEPPTMMSALLPLEIISSHRTMFLEEPERVKTHRSYGNMDMIGNKSKKGATDYRYDLEAMFR